LNIIKPKAAIIGAIAARKIITAVTRLDKSKIPTRKAEHLLSDILWM